MKVNFMGLTGPEGVLPLYYTAMLAERTRSGDRSAVDFLIFSITVLFRFFTWPGRNIGFRWLMSVKVWTLFHTICWI